MGAQDTVVVPGPGRGLRRDGTIEREGALDRVPTEFVPVVNAARARVTRTFGTRMHSAYLYGSIPRGTATPGISDLDMLVALHDEADDAARADARSIEEALDSSFPQISGVGIGLASAPSLLSELERFDLGFFVACLCTPLTGPDLADQLPRYRPTGLLARETNGDLALLLPRWRARFAEAVTGDDRRALSRAVARRLVRTGFTLVMPRWGGWTSDLDESAALFGRYYPERAGQMRLAAEIGRTLSADPAVLRLLIDDLGPWLAAEYTTVHGAKAPRPGGVSLVLGTGLLGNPVVAAFLELPLEFSVRGPVRLVPFPVGLHGVVVRLRERLLGFLR